jgi:predicted permease
MFSAPLALSMIVLSERFDFYRDAIASFFLITSLSAGNYLNLWLMILE